MKTVAVAMSGGVDSSVAAALLLEQGYQVHGVSLHLWQENQDQSTVPEAVQQAQRVADQLRIPFSVCNMADRFKAQIVQPFVEEYLQGKTPSPCVSCNRTVKWHTMLEFADSHQIETVATGHYARLSTDTEGFSHLLRGKDLSKDQSYMLAFMGQAEFSRTLFPVGGFSKPEIREIARRFSLVVAERSDSQDLCFLPSGDYRRFVRENADTEIIPGEIVDTKGNVLGHHSGLPFYTIGQRKGLGVAAPNPLYVLGKDLENNQLIVAEKEGLGKREFFAAKMNWILGKPPSEYFRAEMKIRYRASLAWGEVNVEDGNQVTIVLDKALSDITPGQVVVIYQENEVLGGGIIQASK